MNQLATVRKQYGLTQVEAAKICGVSRRTLQNYEENESWSEACDRLVKMIQENQQAHRNRIVSLLFIKFTCRQIFEKYPEVECAYLYGSYARGEARGDSDIDILVVCPAMGMKFYHLVGELRDGLNKEVDLQTHRQVGDNPDFLEALLREGIKIYSKK